MDTHDPAPESIDLEDILDTAKTRNTNPSFKPKRLGQKYCNCTHDVLDIDPDNLTRRNLVVCIDGTANQFSGHKNTNVVELYSRLEKNKSQLTYYNSGIGTYAHYSLSTPWDTLKHSAFLAWDKAFATQLRRIILKAYRWICEHYHSGDRIFLFGFSRGAYQVRALSGMIQKVGLIHRGNEAQIPFAYELYEKCSPHPEKHSRNSMASHWPHSGGNDDQVGVPTPRPTADSENGDRQPHQDNVNASPDKRCNQRTTSIPNLKDRAKLPQTHKDGKPSSDPNEAAELFKQTFCRGDVKVHFVGVWDTVSSVGFIRGKDQLPLTINGMKHVCFFRHALARDERRVKFLPEYVQGGLGPSSGETEPARCGVAHTKEVWFAGSHSDIGGNIPNRKINNNGPALRWMAREAASTGLLLTPSSTKWSQLSENVHKSLTWLWWPLEYLPIKRLVHNDPENATRTTRWGERRTFAEGQLVHGSVIQKLDSHQKYDFDDPFQGLLPQSDPRIERDQFGEITSQILAAVDLLCHITDSDDREKHLRGLSDIFGGFDAQQALLNLSRDLYVILEQQESISGEKVDLEKGRVMTLEKALAMIDVLTYTAADLFEKLHFSKMPPVIRTLLSDDGDLKRKSRYQEHAKRFLQQFGRGPVTSFAFSDDGKQIACGTASGGVFVREVPSGKEVLMSHNQAVSDYSVQEHSNPVLFISFTRDGRYIVSGSQDSIRIWDAKSGTHQEVHKCHGPLFSLTCSETEILTLSLPKKKSENQMALELQRYPVPSNSQDEHRLPDPIRLNTQDSVVIAEVYVSRGQSVDGTGKDCTVVTSSINRSINIWDSLDPPDSPKEVPKEVPKPVSSFPDPNTKTPRHRGDISSLTFSNDNTTIFAASRDGAISVWDANKGQVLAIWAAATGDSIMDFSGWLGAAGKRTAATALALIPRSDDESNVHELIVGLQNGQVIIWAWSAETRQTEAGGSGRVDEQVPPEREGTSQTEAGDSGKADEQVPPERKGTRAEGKSADRRLSFPAMAARTIQSMIYYSGYNLNPSPADSLGKVDVEQAPEETPEGKGTGTRFLAKPSPADSLGKVGQAPEETPEGKGSGTRFPAKQGRTLQYSSSPIVSVASSPDRKLIAACNKDGQVIVWDAKGPDGECIVEQLKGNEAWFPNLSLKSWVCSFFSRESA
ncbi:hypothetical protein VNI00_011656 [Paramarasmius palmivorus]|uniref:T6SS Phospholipase effector Tle1-like catalytic domain-containing protein n=1 Tax=Paramarasmius palmivorus TaxID=297713 RepID=A0AAW0CEM5_9AGAR